MTSWFQYVSRQRCQTIIGRDEWVQNVATIKIAPKKQKDNGITIKSAYFNSKPQIITDNTNIYKTLGIIAQELLNLIG